MSAARLRRNVRFRSGRAAAGGAGIGDEGRLLPLINVIFLLLVVFLVAGRFAGTDPFGVAPPSSSSAGAAPEPERVVHVAADGRLALDGAPTDEAGLRSAAPGLASSREVHLEADGRADSARVIEVMEVLRDAGVERVLLLTRAADR